MPAFSPRSAAFVAFSSGSLCSLQVRPGSRAPVVVVAGFSSHRGAARFARRAARAAGVSVAVRPGPGGWLGAWLVPTPVAWPSSHLPGSGRALPVSGGLRGLVAALPRAGLGARWSA
jgi:hypothetical protein